MFQRMDIDMNRRMGPHVIPSMDLPVIPRMDPHMIPRMRLGLMKPPPGTALGMAAKYAEIISLLPAFFRSAEK